MPLPFFVLLPHSAALKLLYALQEQRSLLCMGQFQFWTRLEHRQRLCSALAHITYSVRIL